MSADGLIRSKYKRNLSKFRSGSPIQPQGVCASCFDKHAL